MSQDGVKDGLASQEQIGKRITYYSKVAIGDKVVVINNKGCLAPLLYREIRTVSLESRSGYIKIAGYPNLFDVTRFARFDEWPAVPIESVEQAKKYAESEEWELQVTTYGGGWRGSRYNDKRITPTPYVVKLMKTGKDYRAIRTKDKRSTVNKEPTLPDPLVSEEEREGRNAPDRIEIIRRNPNHWDFYVDGSRVYRLRGENGEWIGIPSDKNNEEVCSVIFRLCYMRILQIIGLMEE
jgi:hypothetical protein